jgi:DNA-binding transcriptional LysR family regulator
MCYNNFGTTNYHLMLRYVLHGLGAAIMDEMCIKVSTSFGRSWKELATYPLDLFLPPALWLFGA